MVKEEKRLQIYDSPYIYDIAFSFRDISKEVDFFEQCISRFSKVKVKRVLDIGCGPSPYMLELVKRGYAFAGLDLSRAMLDYSLEKAQKAGVRMEAIHANMRNFKATHRFDFAFCMLGSVDAESNSDFTSHLNSVADCLESGGLYLVDAVARFDWTKPAFENWTVLKDELTVNVTWTAVPTNYVEQKETEKMTIEALEKGKKKISMLEKTGKIIFPQEFLELVNKNARFEFLGWYNSFDLAQPLEKATRFNRPMTVLRRK